LIRRAPVFCDCSLARFCLLPKQSLLEGIMADHSQNSGPLEVGAKMDYPEHDKTYHRFLGLAKWGAVSCIGLMAAMAFGFFVGGFFSGSLLFLLILGAAYVIL
jgi:Bacterial aa3 type cytochrome c oxidase subunit IV